MLPYFIIVVTYIRVSYVSYSNDDVMLLNKHLCMYVMYVFIYAVTHPREREREREMIIHHNNNKLIYLSINCIQQQHNIIIIHLVLKYNI